jgi:hypothetical protein
LYQFFVDILKKIDQLLISIAAMSKEDLEIKDNKINKVFDRIFSDYLSEDSNEKNLNVRREINN